MSSKGNGALNSSHYDISVPIHALPIRWYRKVRSKKPSNLSSISATNREGNNSSCNETHRADNIMERQTNSEIYIGIDALLSFVHLESGPALKVKSNSTSAQKVLENHDLLDINPATDSTENADNIGQASKRFGVSLVRIVPLDVIKHALPGEKWSWQNILQLGSGICDCSVKVYSVASQSQLLGSGKKVLLFDVVATGVMHNIGRDEIISLINSAAKANRTKMSAYKVDAHEESIQFATKFIDTSASRKSINHLLFALPTMKSA